MNPQRKRISYGTEMLLKGSAWFVYITSWPLEIILDFLFGIGLIVGPVYSGIFYCLAELALRFKGASLIDPKKVLDTVFSLVLADLPIINLFYVKRTKSGLFVPGMYGIISGTIERIKAEDEEFNSKNKPFIKTKKNISRQLYQNRQNRPEVKQRSLTTQNKISTRQEFKQKQIQEIRKPTTSSQKTSQAKEIGNETPHNPDYIFGNQPTTNLAPRPFNSDKR